MKKHAVAIMNMALVLAVLGLLAFVLFKAIVPTERAEVGDFSNDIVPTVSASPISPDGYRIGVLQNDDRPSTQECYAGFLSQISERGLKDHVETDYVLETDVEKLTAQAQRLVDENCDLIYAIGPVAAKCAASLTTEIPVVFAAVNDPEEENLVDSNGEPGGNVTGVSSYTPCFEQIDVIPLLVPEAKKIGAIYSLTDKGSVMQTIIAERESVDIGLEFEKYPVLEAKEIPSLLEKMNNDGVDVIYIPIDKLIYDNFRNINAFTEKTGIPTVCGDEYGLSLGGFATCLINYNSIGKKCADMFCDIVIEGKSAATMPVIYKYECYNFVNKDALAKLGVTLSQEAQDAVELKSYGG